MSVAKNRMGDAGSAILSGGGTSEKSWKQVVQATATPGSNWQKKGLEKVMYRLERGQIQALRAEAFKRAQERGSGRPDASEVLREIVAAWMGKSPK